MDPGAFTDYSEPESHVTRIREVALLPEEKVSHVFSPEHGLVEELPDDGRLLVTTNQRIISFSKGQGRNETSLVPIEELKGIVIEDHNRRSVPLFQIVLLGLVGIFTYVLAAYWLTSRFDGPSVPIINLDFGPLVLLLAILGGAFLAWQYYLARVDSMVTFQASSWTFTFPYQGLKAEEEIYQVVHTLFVARQSGNGYSPPWEE